MYFPNVKINSDEIAISRYRSYEEYSKFQFHIQFLARIQRTYFQLESMKFRLKATRDRAADQMPPPRDTS